MIFFFLYLLADINFIEADIVFGYLKNDELKTRQPIMAHPPGKIISFIANKIVIF